VGPKAWQIALVDCHLLIRDDEIKRTRIKTSLATCDGAVAVQHHVQETQDMLSRLPMDLAFFSTLESRLLVA
jgi:hypothetical protein